MSHIPSLIIDLALILVSAGIFTLIFKRIKQPLVLGYIVAGILAGPYVDYLPTVVDKADIDIWAEIGVVFLLFALGLDFSIKKLARVGNSVFITAVAEVTGMLFIGVAIGTLLGWSLVNSIILGGMLSMSSTTIIIKTIDDLGLHRHRFASIVFGILVVEDLIAILILVLLPTFAASNTFESGVLFQNVLKVTFFLILWFLVGVFMLPAFLKVVKKYINEETLLIISLGLCLGMVVISTRVGFSAALGAFVMGSILAETVEAKEIEHIITPVKNLFGAIFFVSVGMMLNPATLVEHISVILLLSLATIVGKALFSALGVLFSGQSLKTSVQVGMSLSQIGEFSFIIAALAANLGMLQHYIGQVIVAVSVLTTFTTPYMIRYADPFSSWLTKVMPAKLFNCIERFSTKDKCKTGSEWGKIIKHYLLKIVVISVLMSAILLLSVEYVSLLVANILPGDLGKFTVLVITLLLMAPFLRVLIIDWKSSPDLFNVWNNRKENKVQLLALATFSITIAVAFICIAIFTLFKLSIYTIVLIAVATVLLIFLLRNILNQYVYIERYFLNNFNARANKHEGDSFTEQMADSLKNSNLQLSYVTVPEGSMFGGKTLSTSDFRSNFGINILKIIRGSKHINIPAKNECLFPSDKILIVGRDERVDFFEEELQSALNNEMYENDEIVLTPFSIHKDYFSAPYSALESRLDEAKCLIVAIGHNNNNKTIDFDSSRLVSEDDRVWVAGGKTDIKKLCDKEILFRIS